jgi:hypothetical protein
MLEFVRRFFKQKEQETETIRLGEVRTWFAKETDEDLKSLKIEIQIQCEKIREAAESGKALIQRLETSALRNEQIDQRSKDIMAGNRKTYCRKTLDLFNSLPGCPEPEEIPHTIEQFEQQLKDYTESTKKSYYILQQFFADESGAVAGKVKDIDNGIRSYKDLIEKTRYPAISKALDKMAEYNKQAKAKKGFLANVAQLEDEKTQIRTDLEKNQTKISELRSSEGFQAYNMLIDRKNAEEQAHSDAMHELSGIVNSLEPLLRKSADWQKYLLDPKKALKDKEEFISALAKCRQLLNEQHDLSEKRVERAKAALDKATPESIGQLADRIAGTKAEAAYLAAEIMKNSAMQDYTELEYKSTHLRSRISAIERDQEAARLASTKIDLDTIKEELKKAISEYLGRPIAFA